MKVPASRLADMDLATAAIIGLDDPIGREGLADPDGLGWFVVVTEDGAVVAALSADDLTGLPCSAPEAGPTFRTPSTPDQRLGARAPVRRSHRTSGSGRCEGRPRRKVWATSDRRQWHSRAEVPSHACDQPAFIKGQWAARSRRSGAGADPGTLTLKGPGRTPSRRWMRMLTLASRCGAAGSLR